MIVLMPGDGAKTAGGLPPNALHRENESVFLETPFRHGPLPEDRLTMPLSPKHNADQLAANFAEIEPRYSEQQALIESSRCLFCFDAPCITACPTGIDIPAFIKKIMTGNLTGAGADHPLGQYPRRKLRAGLPDRSPVRRRLRAARSRQRPDQNRPAPALRDRSRLRKPRSRCLRPAAQKVRQTRCRSSAADRPDWAARRSWRNSGTKSSFSSANRTPADSTPTASPITR